jgi:hypothetical protein
MHSESYPIEGLTRNENEPYTNLENHSDKHHEKSGNSQTHVHEYQGSTKIAEEEEDPHNHRFAGVTSEVIPKGNSHVHQLLGNSDFYENHHHEVGDTTGLAIPVGNGRHVHFVCGTTTLDDGHVHEFNFATLIDNPIGD